jgi:hypothetical protein
MKGKTLFVENTMKNREIIVTVIVLLGIGWLFFANYNKTAKTDKKPATIEHVQPK